MSQNDTIHITETPAEKQAREARLRGAEIMRRLKAIDNQRIRPLAAIVSGNSTDEDMDRLSALESEAQALREELAKLNTEVS